MRIILYGQGKAIDGLQELCSLQGYHVSTMDDEVFDTQQLDKADVIVVSPYIGHDHKIFTRYRDKINTELQFLGQYRYSHERTGNLTVIGIAGTKGKSTTSRLLSQLLSKLNLDADVWHCGYMRQSVGEVFASIKKNHNTDQEHILVVECSGMMIEDLHDRWFDYSIWTTSHGGLLDGFVTQSHLEEIKLRFMDHTRRMIVTDQEASVHVPSALRSRIKISDPQYDLTGTQLRGSHNACNLSAALIVAHRIIVDMDISVSPDLLRHAVSSLRPLKHHLIPLATLYGATIYDDNISQEPHDQLTALQSVPEPVVLIAMGAMDASQIPMLEQVYRDRVAVAILHSSCPTALAEYCDQRGVPYHCAPTLQDAVMTALHKVQEYGYETILFSPGGKPEAPLHDLYMRGKAFEDIIDRIVHLESEQSSSYQTMRIQSILHTQPSSERMVGR